MKEYCNYCGSEMRISKKGNLYCSNICWTKEPWKSEREQNQLDWEAEIESMDIP